MEPRCKGAWRAPGATEWVAGWRAGCRCPRVRAQGLIEIHKVQGVAIVQKQQGWPRETPEVAATTTRIGCSAWRRYQRVDTREGWCEGPPSGVVAATTGVVTTTTGKQLGCGQWGASTASMRGRCTGHRAQGCKCDGADRGPEEVEEGRAVQVAGRADAGRWKAIREVGWPLGREHVQGRHV